MKSRHSSNPTFFSGGFGATLTSLLAFSSAIRGAFAATDVVVAGLISYNQKTHYLLDAKWVLSNVLDEDESTYLRSVIADGYIASFSSCQVNIDYNTNVGEYTHPNLAWVNIHTLENHTDVSYKLTLSRLALEPSDEQAENCMKNFVGQVGTLINDISTGKAVSGMEKAVIDPDTKSALNSIFSLFSLSGSSKNARPPYGEEDLSVKARP